VPLKYLSNTRQEKVLLSIVLVVDVKQFNFASRFCDGDATHNAFNRAKLVDAQCVGVVRSVDLNVDRHRALKPVLVHLAEEFGIDRVSGGRADD
jgi:hypothetical protein